MDYENQAMLIVYGIISDPEFDWSSDFSNEVKSGLIKILINYFEKPGIEEYERCSKLQNMLDRLESRNEFGNINKGITE